MNRQLLLLAVSFLAAAGAGCGADDGIAVDVTTRESMLNVVPASWTPVPGWSFVTAHPYANRASIYKQLLAPAGATRLRLVVRGRFELESGYDFLEVQGRNASGQWVVTKRYTGTIGPALSEVLVGHEFWLRLMSDVSITKYGFELAAEWAP